MSELRKARIGSEVTERRREMSLVDYASSSDDDVSEAEEQEQKDEQSLNPNDQPQISTYQPSPPPRKSGSSTSNQRPETAAPPSLRPPAFEKLPDACVLLNSASKPVVSGTDHASRVAAAMAENATRKRDSNDVSSTLRRNKLPRGSLPNSKNVLDTAGGLLVPPQLNGRSVYHYFKEQCCH
ncbi:hypothetical protein KPL70_013351 [Citrus sinensis]|nr:uncharacterized protein LOC102614271 isoform X3 [Citrus sinensis]XP_024041701.1 uncharacterized protein LOC112098956 isoform X3 [Citrus x clementina]KAH9709955.1 hypothetical protein KPL70_013351 [Citrus sinensis]